LSSEEISSKEIKHVATAIIELCLSEGIGQSVSQSVVNRKILKFYNNLMQQFRVDLKTSLGMAVPNQYSQTVRKQISSWLWGDNFGPKSPNRIYSTTVLYDC